jgi:CGNR zinc finger
MIAFQSALRGLAVKSPTKWETYWQDFSSAPNMSLGVRGAFAFAENHSVRFHWHSDPKLEWRGSRNVAVIEEGNALSAMLATIEIDHLRGAKFGVCARPDCRVFYEITSAHGRRYCGQYCAHIESVRRTRKRQKQKAQKSGSASRKRSGRK